MEAWEDIVAQQRVLDLKTKAAGAGGGRGGGKGRLQERNQDKDLDPQEKQRRAEQSRRDRWRAEHFRSNAEDWGPTMSGTGDLGSPGVLRSARTARARRN